MNAGDEMNNSSKIGLFFIAVAAFLYAAKHLTAAVMISNINSVNTNYFGGGYDSIETGITIWTAAALIAGVICLALGQWDSVRRKILYKKKDQEI
ncbi:hypothetical protein HMPREF3291_24275 [Bacillus sp. HMSC76G11]|nr:hypothetical protein HMPREF3291_24275 [Bacillus sp. HMSC76G11]